MARRSNILIVPLLVMVGVLIGAILLTPGADAVPVGDPTTSGAAADPAPVDAERAAVADSGARRTAVGPESATGPDATARIFLRGRLVDEAGVAQAGVELLFRATVRTGFERIDALAERDTETTVEVVTDADGRFEITTEQGRGASLVLARGADRLFASNGDRRLMVAAHDADHDLGDLVVTPAVSVRGRVLDEAGRPIPTALVRANRRGEAGFALWRTGEGVAVDGDGNFELRGLPVGELEVRASSRDFVPQAVFVEAGLGEVVADIEIRLPRGASVAGIVADERGTPIAGAKVVAYRELSTTPGVETRQIDASEAKETDAGGWFQLQGLLGERVALRVWCDGHEAVQRTDVAIGTHNLDIRLDRLGSIAGRVLSVADPTVPMVGSTVTATRSAPRGRGTPGFTRPVTVQTDAEGRFVLEGVPPGLVRVAASGNGHLDSRPHDVKVAPGEQLEYVDLYVETGAVVEAQVFNPGREPVAGATVTVLAPSDAPPAGGEDGVQVRSVRLEAGPAGFLSVGGPRVLGTAVTDASGVARVDGLPPGRAILRATHPEYAPSADENVLLPRNRSTEWVATLRLAGHVALSTVDADGAPLAGAPYVVRPQAGGEPVRGETDGDGRARVGPLLPGSYVAALEQPPRATDLGAGTMSFVLAGSGGSELEQSAKPVQVTAGAEVALTLQRPVLTRLHGRVSDVNGPVAGAVVRLRESGAIPIGAQATRTGADGRYSVDALLPGSYELEWSRVGALLPHRTTVDVQQGIPEIELDLQLGGGQVRVSVVDTEGRAIQAAKVRIERPATEGQPARRAVMMVSLLSADDGAGASTTSMTIGGTPTVETGADGIAVLEDVPPGTFRVVAEHDGFVEAARDDVVVVDRQLTDAGSLTLSAAAIVTGALTDWPDGLAIDLALIEIRAKGSEAQPRRETVQGRSYRVGGLAAGEYELRARALGGDDEAFGATRTITVEPGGTAELDLPLR